MDLDRDKMLKHNPVIVGEEAEHAQAQADKSALLPADQIDPETFFMKQHWDRYSAENHDTWRRLYAQRILSLREQASDVFLKGFDAFGLPANKVPDITTVNDVLRSSTGWQSRPVPGYLPAKSFFACLAQRKFPTTITIRPPDELDYLPEPDIFHDVFGHVPLHADPTFADFLQTYGKAALHAGAEHEAALTRLFWFTVEFGLIHEDNRLKIYGSGLMSSVGESNWALHGDGARQPERRAFDLDKICDTHFEIDDYQPLYYVLDSFDQLRDAMMTFAERVLNDANIPVKG